MSRFSSPYVMANWISSGFELLVGQNKQYDDISLSLWRAFFTMVLRFLDQKIIGWLLSEENDGGSQP